MYVCRSERQCKKVQCVLQVRALDALTECVLWYSAGRCSAEGLGMRVVVLITFFICERVVL